MKTKPPDKDRRNSAGRKAMLAPPVHRMVTSSLNKRATRKGRPDPRSDEGKGKC